MSEEHPPIVVNVDELEEEVYDPKQPCYGAAIKRMTPSMAPRGGKLGMRQVRVSKGQTACVFHHHLLEDEVFFVMSGRGVLRYGDQLHELRQGDCISCPAGTGQAHQIANPFDEDLVYLAVGPHEPAEVCVYPDSETVMIRKLGWRSAISSVGRYDREPQPPAIFEHAKKARVGP